MSTEEVDGTIEFLAILAQLKNTKRQGWVENNVNEVESVADHMYRMSVLAMMCPDKTLNRDHMVRMALCHDMAEAIVGDITPKMNVDKAEKQRLERDALTKMVKLLPGANSEEVQSLWEEYEAQETKEAQFVRDLDLLEMVAQAHTYEKAQEHVELPTFYPSAAKIKHPWAKSIADRLVETRPKPPKATSE